MAIETLGSINQLLQNHDSNAWVRDVNKGDIKLDLDVASLTNDNRKFSDFLADSIMQINNLQQDANEAIEKLATGESKNIHETLMVVERAEIAFKTMNQIRQRIIEAYQEVMKMQV